VSTGFREKTKPAHGRTRHLKLKKRNFAPREPKHGKDGGDRRTTPLAAGFKRGKCTKVRSAYGTLGGGGGWRGRGIAVCNQKEWHLAGPVEPTKLGTSQ